MFAKTASRARSASTASLNYQLEWAMARGLVRTQDTGHHRRQAADLDSRLRDDVGLTPAAVKQGVRKSFWRSAF